jgi:hypothetical protein
MGDGTASATTGRAQDEDQVIVVAGVLKMNQ